MQILYPALMRSHEKDFAKLQTQVRRDISARPRPAARPGKKAPKYDKEAEIKKAYGNAKRDFLRRHHTDLFAPERNIKDGVTYLVECLAHAKEQLTKSYGHAPTSASERKNWYQRASAYYNAGRARVDKKGIPASTRAYITGIAQYRAELALLR
jgi:hypothetical protein